MNNYTNSFAHNYFPLAPNSDLVAGQAALMVTNTVPFDREPYHFTAARGLRNEMLSLALQRFNYEPEEASLLHLVPLVQTAWAEGVVTRRERQLVLEAARWQGISPGSRSWERLAGWLDFEPTEEFYENSLMLLRASFHDLPADERERNRLNTLALCAQVAETSGGSPTYTGGGRRICNEEVRAVMRIAAELSEAGSREAFACLALAETTGLADVSALRALRDLGYTAETVRVLPLVPLVEMAWAEGNVTRGERRIITTAARLRDIRPGDQAYVFLTSLLEAKPSNEFFERSFTLLQKTFELLPPELRQVDEWDLLASCSSVAGASTIDSDFSDSRDRICPEERTLLHRFTAKLNSAAPAHAARRSVGGQSHLFDSN